MSAWLGWQDLSADPTAWVTNAITDVVATNSTVTFTDTPGANTSRFYRVRLKALYEGI